MKQVSSPSMVLETHPGLWENRIGAVRKFPSILHMQRPLLIAGRKSLIPMLVAFELFVLVPSLFAQQNKAGSDSPQAAWVNIQQFVKDMETAVHSKNLHG